MDLKLSVSIGATLQVKNANGEWDWIKPEVGAEISIAKGEVVDIQEEFSRLWDDIVGPQFKSVVNELLVDQAQPTDPTNGVYEDSIDTVDTVEETNDESNNIETSEEIWEDVWED